MKIAAAVAVLLLLAGCTTTEIKGLESRLATVEAEVMFLKAVAHEPHSSQRLLKGGTTQ